jgi:hypothetical protein
MHKAESKKLEEFALWAILATDRLKKYVFTIENTYSKRFGPMILRIKKQKAANRLLLFTFML